MLSAHSTGDPTDAAGGLAVGLGQRLQWLRHVRRECSQLLYLSCASKGCNGVEWSDQTCHLTRRMSLPVIACTGCAPGSCIDRCLQVDPAIARIFLHVSAEHYPERLGKPTESCCSLRPSLC